MTKCRLFDGKEFPAFERIADDEGNEVDQSKVFEVLREVVTVDSSAGGTGTETAILTVPADSLILNVIAEVVTPMDGDTTTTFEVGVTANPDQFIDTLDFDPSAAAGTQAASLGGTNNDTKVMIWTDAAIDIAATWTNTANMTAGSTKVTVVYIPLA